MLAAPAAARQRHLDVAETPSEKREGSDDEAESGPVSEPMPTWCPTPTRLDICQSRQILGRIAIFQLQSRWTTRRWSLCPARRTRTGHLHLHPHRSTRFRERTIAFT